MEPSYSVWADWLSKFHTWSEGVQALGVIAGATRVLVAVLAIFHRPPPRRRKGRGRRSAFFLSSAMPEAPHLTRRTMLPE
ncbi:hypothetical protein [Microvirga brassicacearum]|uniref:Uncharacterized protein n=1 Tax=Microvirga brassicacearum TaxID=2580413 RepID=A0A5N3P4Z9_9HYPH|nr:hypothetical protein [Microvirga brassicacearum]KAB0264812.1 hypothetical protein FEZ63_21415 [Microvirga brassicacearum]